MANMDGKKFQEELKNSDGLLLDKLKRFGQVRLKKCQGFKSFEQKHSNAYLCKNLPRELIKKVKINIKALNPQILVPTNKNRMNGQYLSKLLLDGETDHYEHLKKAVIDKLKDIREYDLEMIHEESRDFICQEIKPSETEKINEYIEYTQKIDMKTIVEVLEFLKTNSYPRDKYERPDELAMANVDK